MKEKKVSYSFLIKFPLLPVLGKPEQTKVNIGFSVPKVSLQERQAWMTERKTKRFNTNFEKEVKSCECK